MARPLFPTRQPAKSADPDDLPHLTRLHDSEVGDDGTQCAHHDLAADR